MYHQQFPQNIQDSQRSYRKFIVQEVFANLSLSDDKREAITCQCYYLYLNSKPEAQHHVREDGSKYCLKLFVCLSKQPQVVSIQKTQFLSPPRWPQRIPCYPFTLPLVIIYMPSIRVVNISISSTGISPC